MLVGVVHVAIEATFVGVTLDASTTNNMTKKRHLSLKETTLRRFELQSVTIQPIERSSKTIRVLIKGLRKDDDVI